MRTRGGEGEGCEGRRSGGNVMRRDNMLPLYALRVEEF